MSNPRIEWLSPADPADSFPTVESALREPDGLLAAGGDLCSERLLYAYSRGIFPWYEEGQPILWWSPDPRCILRPDELRVSRRLRTYIRKSAFTWTCNHAFADVIRTCAGERRSRQGTWITPDIMTAFERLHAEGWAHSVEIWDGDDLAGGLYGLCIGRVFFGESMFSQCANASKFAMLSLCRILLANGFALLDCQVVSQHLLTLGATRMPRTEFCEILQTACVPAEQFSNWPQERQPVAELDGD